MYAFALHYPSCTSTQFSVHINYHLCSVQANASVQVDTADPYGILITNGEFTAFVDSNFGTQVLKPVYIILYMFVNIHDTNYPVVPKSMQLQTVLFRPG